MMKNTKDFPRLWEEYSWSRAVSLRPLTQLCLGSPKIVEPKSALVKLVNYLGEENPLRVRRPLANCCESRNLS